MTDNVTLRPITLDDVDAVQRFASDELVARTTTTPHPYPPDGARAYVDSALQRRAEGTAHTFAILADGEFVGTLGVGNIDLPPPSRRASSSMNQPAGSRSASRTGSR